MKPPLTRSIPFTNHYYIITNYLEIGSVCDILEVSFQCRQEANVVLGLGEVLAEIRAKVVKRVVARGK